MRARALICLLTAGLLAAPAADAAPRLKTFKTCPSLIRYGNRHVAQFLPSTQKPAAAQPPQQVPAGGGSDSGGSAPAPAAAAPVAGEDFSTTNVQEAGVDEPDLVKT